METVNDVFRLAICYFLGAALYNYIFLDNPFSDMEKGFIFATALCILSSVGIWPFGKKEG